MINFNVDMVVKSVDACKSASGNEYKTVIMTGSSGSIKTCIFPDGKIYGNIKAGERRHVTVVSRLYNGKEKVFVNIKEVVIPDNPVPFEGSEGATDWVNADGKAFEDLKK